MTRVMDPRDAVVHLRAAAELARALGAVDLADELLALAWKLHRLLPRDARMQVVA